MASAEILPILFSDELKRAFWVMREAAAAPAARKREKRHGYIYIYVPRLMCVCTGKSDDGDAHDAEPPFHKLAREPSHSPPSLF